MLQWYLHCWRFDGSSLGCHYRVALLAAATLTLSVMYYALLFGVFFVCVLFILLSCSVVLEYDKSMNYLVLLINSGQSTTCILNPNAERIKQ